MLINPQKLIDDGYVTGLKDPDKQIQPNAIDFTLDQLFTFDDANIFAISENGKQMRGNSVVRPTHDRRTGLDYFILQPHTSYDALSDMYVELPDGVAASLIIRSTFNRNGVFLTAGLYDTAFKGHVGFALHNRSGQVNVTPGTRVGQIMFYQSDNAGTYSGSWNHDQGTKAGQHKD